MGQDKPAIAQAAPEAILAKARAIVGSMTVANLDAKKAELLAML